MTYNLRPEINPKKYVSWGKGVQSTFLCVLASEGFLGAVGGIITAETGWEHPHTYLVEEYYTKYFEKNNIPVYKVSGGNIQEMVELDIPFRTESGKILRRQCTGTYKITPIRRKIRELNGLNPNGYGRSKPNSFHLFLGISWDESERMAISDVNYITNQYPLIDNHITRNDCIQGFKDRNLPVPRKSSCVCCPYKGAESWLMTKTEYPEEWKKVIEFDERFRTPPQAMIDRGHTENLYLYKNIPLKDVNFEGIIEDKKEDICDSGYCFI